VVAAIYLIVRGIINYRLMLSYLLTITGISLFLGLFYCPGNALSYTLLQLATGGIMFASVFMITDPVTSPKSMNGKIIYGIGAGALTMLIRVNSDYPEGVMFSIALMNMLTPLIDSCIKGTTFTNIGKKWITIACFFVGAIGLNVGFNALYPLNDGEKSNVQMVFGKSSSISTFGTIKEEEIKLGINASYKVKSKGNVYYVYDITVKDPIGEEETSFVLGLNEEGEISLLQFISYGDDWAKLYGEKYINRVTGKNKVGVSDSVSGATATGSVIRNAINGAIAHFGGAK